MSFIPQAILLRWVYIERTRTVKTSRSIYVHQRLVSIQMVTGSSWGGQLPSGYAGLIFHKGPCAQKKTQAPQTVHVALVLLGLIVPSSRVYL